MIALCPIQNDFIENSMCIDTPHLNERVSSRLLSDHTDLITRYLSELIDASIKKQGDKKIKLIYSKYSQEITCSHLNEFFETIWHVFSVFSKGGLRDLFLYQQNEDWYPKIILTQELKPNDISSLDDPITIYRGCNYRELEQNNFGQSWTTNKKIAEAFAFHHYASQPWFNKKERIIIKALINKKDVYYSNQASAEKEVSVNPNKLINVAKCV